MSQPDTIPNQPEKPRSRRNLRSVGEVALNHVPEPVRRRSEDYMIQRLLRGSGFEARLLTKEEDIQKAIELEQTIWHQEQYDDPRDYDYEKYTPQSRTFAAYDSDGRLVGMNRLFSGTPELPPFIEKMVIDDPVIKDKLIQESKDLKAEEFGTVGVVKELRGNSRVFLDLCRLAYRDATERNIQTWGIVMEPDRVEKMNRALGFTFKQIGPEKYYQGGWVAAHIMDFDDVRQNMSTTKPGLYDWFVNQPLSA